MKLKFVEVLPYARQTLIDQHEPYLAICRTLARQFERLCLWLVEREGYQRAEHLGEAGSEQGRDVIAYLAADDGSQLWYFQCKRYQTINAVTLIAEVAKYNEHIEAGTIAKPHGIVFVTNAVLSARARKAVEECCRKHGYECEFWARTELDLKVKKHDAIIKEFFNLNFKSQIPNLHSIEVARLPRLLTPDLFGRERELRMLDDAWANPQTNVISFVAWGGVGKSAIVSHWLQAIEQDNWRGAERVFAWSFYSQGTTDTAATAEYFINAALRWFGGDELADKLQTSGQWEKGERLAQLIRQTRTLLILDGLEPVQQPPMGLDDMPEGGLKEQTMQALLRELAAQQPGLCVISTRAAIADIIQFEGRSVIRHSLDKLSPPAGAQLLRRLKVNGAQEELEAASEEYDGHSLALTLLGSYLADVYAGDVRRRHEIENLEDDRKHGGHARKVLRAYEKWLGESGQDAMLDVLRMMGLFDRPADAASIAALRASPTIAGLTDVLQGLGERRWRQTVAALRDLRLLAEASPNDPDMLDAHPLVREHFRDQLQRAQSCAWTAGNLRLYQHLTRSTKELPDTLVDMTPLFTAIACGCEAGLYSEVLRNVLWKRIFRIEDKRDGTKQRDYYSTERLGSFGAELSAITHFFESCWMQPVAQLPDKEKGHVLNHAGYRLRVIGLPEEAVAPIKEAVNIFEKLGEYQQAADAGRNLSQTCLLMGRIEESLKYISQAVAFARRCSDRSELVINLSRQAYTLHQIGDRERAEAVFIEAESIQSRITPRFYFLSKEEGFHYCDLLLEGERYEEVKDRATKMLEWAAEENYPLKVSLAELLLGKASLHLGKESIKQFSFVAETLNQSVSKIRDLGNKNYLVRALLARAEFHRVKSNYQRAQADLGEAITLAKRGNMRLYLADCYLESTRLALATSERDSARKVWESAKAMIEEMGYHRREKEVMALAAQLDN